MGRLLVRIWNRIRNRRRYVRNVHLIESEMNRIDRQIELQRESLKRTRSDLIDSIEAADNRLSQLQNDLRRAVDASNELRQTLKAYETELDSLRSLKNINEDIQIPALMLVIERMQSIYRTDVDTQIKRQVSVSQS